jgi:gamma-glutamyl:cysteine ligase YbdK (ATP-grasp superfamily)
MNESCGHEPGHCTIECRPSGTVAEATVRWHEAVVDLLEAMGITAALRRLADWLARRLPSQHRS